MGLILVGDDDFDDGMVPPGFSEALQADLDQWAQREKVVALSDRDLIYFHQVLSNPKAIARSSWLQLLEDEIIRRGLRREN